ncbi:MAG: glycoside hydrolase [Clostridia bacterium]|nr:glycoside hydrolase [Clostridia bacterium]
MKIYKIRYGTPEKVTPFTFSPEPACDIETVCPERAERISFKVTDAGCVLSVNVSEDTSYYGFGLQQKGFEQSGKRMQIKTNADTRTNNGNCHAPVPFFVTDKGFGIYVDTARYVTFTSSKEGKVKKDNTLVKEVALCEEELYESKKTSGEKLLLIEIPVAKGVDIYCITGERILDVVSGYNLLSGGGAMPPLWGLGGFYRCCGKFNEEQVLSIAKRMREYEIPCDILGLEPGWQTKSYSCSFVWDEKGRFPNHKRMAQSLIKDNFHLNLWEHCYTHPTSPVFDSLMPYSGDILVWEGLVPDFTMKEARDAFSVQQKALIDEGISGFKLDECDGSDYTGGWFFPDCTEFPSGISGDQYHNLLGVLYCKTLLEALEGKPTFSQVRALSALSSSYPFVLYSDLYDQKEYLLATVNSGFSGILWSPEVRHAANKEELIRRMQAVVFSVMALTNAWYLDEMPWETHGCIGEIRQLLELRMSLVPYLHAAFYRYHKEGRPPVRALVSDYNDDFTRTCDDEYLFGDSLLVAPILYPENKREVKLPEGKWFDFYTGEEKRGSFIYESSNIPVFVKDGTLLPLAKPVQYITEETVFEITLKAYGNTENSSCILIDTTDDKSFTPYTVDKSTKGRIGERFIIV